MTDRHGRSGTIPAEIEPDLRRARRLEWWTLFWTGGIAVVMGLVMGSSQAMKSAWVEDVLSLVPSIVFLVSARFEGRPADRRFPFGYRRVNSLAFLISAVTLVAVGGFLLFEAGRTLVNQEHPTIGLATVFGHHIWMGWVMIAVLVISVVPPFILGRKKLPIAKTLQDKVLHTDALMQKADWMTGLAGVAGIVGLGFGFWWADAAAAGFISFEILRDGIKNLRIATAELVDGTPRALDKDEIADDALELERALKDRFPDAEIQIRECGRYMSVQVVGADTPYGGLIEDLRPPLRRWRVDQVSFVPHPDRQD